MSTPAAYEHNGARVEREVFYAIACDPARSVAVEACAGAGKTWMLVSRIVRALLAGAQPQEILAITFTKKAAGEMRQRLQEWLAHWSSASPEELAQQLRMRGVARPDAAACEALRQLYASLLAAGRPVQIRTFHSWFAALLRGAPLSLLQDLGLPGRYELLEDDSQAVAKVWRRFHVCVAQEPGARRDYEDCVAEFGRSQTLKALEAALAKRVEFEMADTAGVVQASVRPFGDLFPGLAGLATPQEALASEAARGRWLARALQLGAEKNKTPQAAAAAVVHAFEEPDAAARFAMLRKAFFVAGEDRLTQHLTRYAAAQEAETELRELCAACAQHQAWLHQQRLARLGRLLLAQFGALKREQGWVDMNDVERAALAMLSDPVLSGWVQERLDMRVRHLLVDEFQDTNPLQWQALHAWLGSYAGASAGGPSVFLVGDPKQSIYRFRRAEPQVFAAAQDFVVRGLGGDRLSCDHTHRNAPAVLEAVNRTLLAAQQAGEYTGFREHTTQSHADGAICALPQILREAKPTAAAPGTQSPWRDSLTTPRELPEEKLVALECRQAAAWIAQQLQAGMAPGEVMVLARKRDRLAAMEHELRTLGVPAQQPDKTDLCEATEVQDLVALMDALVSPAHDLSLARALKSPLFGLGDEALVEVALTARAARAQGQPLAWLELLTGAAHLSPGLRDVGAALARWKRWVDQLPPHDALQGIYRDGDVLARFAAAAPAPLRASVLANLRALLGASLQVRGGRYLTPYGFVRALKAGGIPGPAVAAADVVRLLTVHGAKGLEADVVILLDADGAAARAETMGVVCDWPGESAAPRRFAFIASESRPPPCSVDALSVEQDARQREELNVLYVAMTRARRRLVLSSVQPLRDADTASWWRRLVPQAQWLQVAGPSALQAPAPQTLELPVLPQLSLAAAVAPQPEQHSAEARFGRAVHRLLELGAQPSGGFPPARLRRVAREFGLQGAAIEDAAATASRILAGEGAWAWDAGELEWAGNEVELYHQGQLLRMDRLVRRRGGQWWVLDYKSAARPQDDPQLLEQMRRYREAVQAACPGEAVRAAFLTGQGRLVHAD